MDSARKTYDIAAEEAASLYVLELLPPQEHHGFEQRLASDPALRELVRELQGNLDALVLDEPERPAPLTVWGRIAAEVKADEAPVLGFPAWARCWAPRLLAAAACLAFGAGLHAWLVPAPKAPLSLAGNQNSTGPAAPAPLVVVRPPIATPLVAPAPPAVATPALPSPTNVAARAEAERLRERVRVLAAQVEALNQVLTQQVALPSGVTRLHVFQLVSTNGSDTARAKPPLTSLPEALALLATGRPAGPPAGTAASADNPETPTASTTTSTFASKAADTVPATGNVSQTTQPEAGPTFAAKDPVIATTADPVAPATGLTLNDGEPIGFYDPDTGRGAIVLNNDSPSPDESFVVWSQSTGADGSYQLKNVGSGSATGQNPVISFNVPTTEAGLSAPTFFVTRELAGDTAAPPAAPSGPVVAAPPPPAKP